MGKNIENFATYFDIPAETLPNVPKITITGDRQISVENYRSINEFSEELIQINCHKKTITLRGSGFAIEKIGDNEMKITGKLMFAELE